MKILVVGAGTVGQVFAWHLRQSGAQVTFFVKPKYSDFGKNGLFLYPLNRAKDKSVAVKFDEFDVISSFEEIEKHKWDQVYVTFSGAAMDPQWLERFGKSVKDATVVTIQPGMNSYETFGKYVPPNQVVRGVVAWISYFTPMPGEAVSNPGVAFWFPFNSKSPFGGDPKRAQEVVHALERGGLPAKHDAGAEGGMVLPSLFLTAGITGLELEDWKFSRLSGSENFKLACRAAREAGELEGAGASVCSIQPFVAHSILKLAQKVIPFDFETYMKEHFTKVGAQTLVNLANYLDLAKSVGKSVPAIEELNRRLIEKRSSSQSH